MASRLIVALSFFALCHSNPVISNGYLYRDGRSFSVGQAYGGNRATGSASINGDVVKAYGSASSDNQFMRNGYGQIYPGQLAAQAQAYDNPHAPYGSAKAVAEAQNTPTYYTVPAPATIVSYEQNFDGPPQGTYEIQIPGAIAAESAAVVNGNSESSVSSVKSDGSGSAQSLAQTHALDSYEVTSTNVKTFGPGSSSATSNANNAYGSTVTSAKTQGYGTASSKSQGEMGSTSTQSQSNGGYGSASSTVNNAQQSASVTASSQGYGSAASNANVNNVKGIQSNTQNLGYGALNTLGSDSVYSADIGYGSIKSSANSQGAGFANANADVNSAGAIKTTANSNGNGSASSTANSGPTLATFKWQVPFGGSRSTVIAQTAGNGSATSSIQGMQSGYRVVNSSANSSGYGTAQSNAQSY